MRARFTINIGFERMKHNPQAITTASQLYFSGESLRNTMKLLRLLGVEVSHQTVYNWIKKYVGLMERYIEKLRPKVSDTWRADELWMKFKGDMKYVSAIMDDETRYWIARAHRLLQELHTHGRRKKWRRVYSELCVSAHAEIKGAFLDYPIYDKSLIEPELKTILMLMYGNIQMMAECFLDFLDTDLKTFAGNQLSDIGNSIGYCPLIEPNKRKYGSKIKLKEGNLTYLFTDELAS